MKAVRFENSRILLTNAPVAEPDGQEALVKVAMAGICATDIEILNGYAQFSGTPGHEFAGIVQDAPGRRDLEGKRVVADINCGCGKCRWCICGDARHCETRTVIGIRGRNGAFAEYCTVPVSNLYVIPDSVETFRAVFAEPLAAALEITQQVHIINTARIAVLGDGKMGLLAALVLKHFSGRVMLLGRHPEKLAIAENQGIETIQTDKGSLPETAAGGSGQFDIVVEATGSPDGIQAALGLVRREGTVVVKTTSRNRSQIDLSSIVVNEIRLLGSRCGDIDLALRFLENRWVDVAALVEKIYSFSDFHEAFRHACRKGSLKVMLDFANP
ncbi:MAG: alcohol dehydrogenase catalytic domain-containing protein [Desulfobacteraceae bacterium]|nr:alcohol dehydrogenase catalytic domain-containing protein [Desulfobacteraceae bacterium]